MVQKTLELPRHGIGKGLMTSQGPDANPPVPLMVRNKGFNIGSACNFIREVDLDECSEHETEAFGDLGLLNLTRVSLVPVVPFYLFTHTHTHTHILFLTSLNPLVHLILGLGEDEGVKLNNWCPAIESTKRSIRGSG